MHISIVATGGTIDKIYFDALSEFQIGDPQIVEVLKAANVTFSYDIEPLLRKDSLELTDDDRQLIVETVAALANERVIITHGTDTMVETARQLQIVTGKTIVLTGAMQPARFRHTDAFYNIASALTAVQLLDHGVYIAMNGQLFTPDNVRKNRARNSFETLDAATDTLSEQQADRSGQLGDVD